MDHAETPVQNACAVQKGYYRQSRNGSINTNTCLITLGHYTAVNVDNTIATDSIVDDKPNTIVTTSMVGVWGGYFLTNISLPFAAVVLPIAELEAGEDAYTKKLKDYFTKQNVASNHCK